MPGRRLRNPPPGRLRPASTLVFHPLTLLNGAKSEASTTGPAPPSTRSRRGRRVPRRLPLGPVQPVPPRLHHARRRPTRLLRLLLDLLRQRLPSVQAVGALHIYATGKAYLQGPDTSIFSSLSGVSYVVGY